MLLTVAPEKMKYSCREIYCVHGLEYLCNKDYISPQLTHRFKAISMKSQKNFL